MHFVVAVLVAVDAVSGGVAVVGADVVVVLVL